jgi:hypothetical protein
MKKALHDSIQEAIQKGWKDMSSSFNSMEDEIKKRFRKARKHATPQQASEDAQTVLADLRKRLQDSSQQVEQKVEERMRSMTSLVKRPLEELSSLKDRAEELGTRIESQIRRRSPEKADEDAEE